MADDHTNDDFEALLEHIRDERGFDFTGYKRASLRRRVDKRMADVGVDNYVTYLERLEVDADEFTRLFNTILINVTRFFRDAEAWAYVAEVVIPAILAGKAPDDPVRVWSPGCASGEEPYTLAILFAEAMGEDDFRRRVKIYATDVDDEALAYARAASYDTAALENVPERLRGRYFERDGERFRFRSDLRRRVIFGRHDLVQDAPISRLDLLSCRNVLMYFNAQAQERIVSQMSFALNRGGWLFLGRAEMLLSHGRLFRPYDLSCRVFTRVGGQEPLPRPAVVDRAGSGEEPSELELVRDAFDVSLNPQIVVGRTGHLESANDAVRDTFGVDRGDVGRLLQDLRISYRPTELRGAIETARVESRRVLLERIEHQGEDGPRYFDVHVRPLGDTVGRSGGAVVEFIDVSAFVELTAELERSKQDLATTVEELQSTSEELETTNEELQSTVEELETTNEELQSTNEELETMNEELQSTNDEQQAVNEQLAGRSREAALNLAYLESVLASVAAAVIAVDDELRVQLWNDEALELWGLREDEVVGRLLSDLDFGLPVADLHGPARRCFETGAPDEVEIAAMDRRGRSMRCRVKLVRTRAVDDLDPAVTLLIETEYVTARTV